VPTFLGFVFLGLATLGSLETPPTRKRLAFITNYLLYIMWYIPLHNGKHMYVWFSPSSNGLWEIIVGEGRGGRGGLCAIALVKWQKPNMSHPKVLAYLIRPKDNDITTCYVHN
jgi:hypothetical protein